MVKAVGMTGVYNEAIYLERYLVEYLDPRSVLTHLDWLEHIKEFGSTSNSVRRKCHVK